MAWVNILTALLALGFSVDPNCKETDYCCILNNYPVAENFTFNGLDFSAYSKLFVEITTNSSSDPSVYEKRLCDLNVGFYRSGCELITS